MLAKVKLKVKVKETQTSTAKDPTTDSYSKSTSKAGKDAVEDFFSDAVPFLVDYHFAGYGYAP